jgi:hypothetical protein
VELGGCAIVAAGQLLGGWHWAAKGKHILPSKLDNECDFLIRANPNNYGILARPSSCPRI